MTIPGTEWALTASSKSRHDTDHALVAAAQAGSVVAFEALHALYAQAIYRVALSITKNSSDAEDVMQYTFMRAYRSLKYFRKEAQFFTWLMRIAINSSLMLLRKRRGQREFQFQSHLDDDNDIIAIDLADSRPNPEHVFHLKQTYASIRGSLDALPERLRIVAELRFLQEKPIQEISGFLGISNAATKSRLGRARRLIVSKDLKPRLRNNQPDGLITRNAYL
jgi:RNA polymerase sigma-70 factor, ECF subfamily